MAYSRQIYSPCQVSDVKGYLERKESQRVAFNARLKEVNPVPGSLTACKFIARGWFYQVHASIVDLQENRAIDWQNTLQNWELGGKKVRIEGTTRPSENDVLVKTIEGTVKETIKGSDISQFTERAVCSLER